MRQFHIVVLFGVLYLSYVERKILVSVVYNYIIIIVCFIIHYLVISFIIIISCVLNCTFISIHRQLLIKSDFVRVDRLGILTLY